MRAPAGGIPSFLFSIFQPLTEVIMEKEKPQRAPTHVIALVFLGLIFILSALVAIFMSEYSGWPLHYGGIFLLVGIILTLSASALRRKSLQK